MWWGICQIFRIIGIGWQRRIRENEDYVRFVSYYLRRRGFVNISQPEKDFSLGVDLQAAYRKKSYAIICCNLKEPGELLQSEAVYKAMSARLKSGCTGALVVTNRDVTHAAWVLADEHNVELMLELTPETAGVPLTRADIITPKNIVSFALGCVAFGAWISKLNPNVELSASACAVMAVLCVLVAWVLCTWAVGVLNSWRYGANAPKEL